MINSSLKHLRQCFQMSFNLHDHVNLRMGGDTHNIRLYSQVKNTRAWCVMIVRENIWPKITLIPVEPHIATSLAFFCVHQENLSCYLLSPSFSVIFSFNVGIVAHPPVPGYHCAPPPPLTRKIFQTLKISLNQRKKQLMNL